ncbi:MAG: protein TolQ [Bdellovibrionota bacterium]
MNEVPAAQETIVSMGAMDLIANASFLVQLVLLLLVIFSVITWAIIFFKWGTFKLSYKNTEDFLDFFWSGKSMDHIYTEAKKHPSSPVARVFQAGYVELQRLMEKERQRKGKASTSDPARMVPPESSITNLERSLSKAGRNEVMKLERSLPFLATTGSTAPFIGLFGTVWGIMNAFQNIGAQGGASLAVVAPGIAEALIATAIGLAAAIPAVMGYNYYIQKVRYIKAQVDSFSEDFLNIVKRNFLAS